MSAARRALVAVAVGLMALALPAVASASTGFKGTVSAAAGVEEVEVCVVEPLPSETCAFPAADGTYKLLGIVPGVYQVEFLPSYRSHLVAQYYNGKAKLSEANRVVVSSNIVTEHIDANLQLGGEIEGTATAVATAVGLREVEVCAQDASTAVAVSCTHTDSAGHYALPSVPPGSYRVGFWGTGPSAGYAPQYWHDRDSFFEAAPIAVGAGATVTGIDAALAEGAQVAGTVSDAASGGPLAGIGVCVIRVTATSPQGCVRTGSEGGYALVGLPAGEYQLVFSPEFSEFAQGEFTLPEADGFQTQYYAGSATRAGASTLALATAQHRGIDAALAASYVASPPAPPGPAPNIAIPPPTVLPQPPAPKPKARCKRGYVRKKVKGRKKCVAKEKRHRRHRGRAKSKPA